MRVQDRTGIAYVVRELPSVPFGPWAVGESMPAEHFAVERARDLIEQGVLVEVEPGELPEDALKRAAGEAEAETKAQHAEQRKQARAAHEATAAREKKRANRSRSRTKSAQSAAATSDATPEPGVAAVVEEPVSEDVHAPDSDGHSVDNS